MPYIQVFNILRFYPERVEEIYITYMCIYYIYIYRIIQERRLLLLLLLQQQALHGLGSCQ